jgi:hypothetical protein
MSIPLDHLYNWVQGLSQNPVILYVFRPHGSKDIFDLDQFSIVSEIEYARAMAPVIVCHDQEPLDFASNQFDDNVDRLEKLLEKRGYVQEEIDLMMTLYCNLSLFPEFKPNWLKLGISINDWMVLLHSEKNSKDVEQYSNQGFIPVYYWSHAIIARDWYRFAAWDSRLGQRSYQKTFLVYCRDWTPSREYRLKFLDLMVSAGLTSDSVVSTQHTNNQGCHISQYKIQDERFTVDTQNLLCIPNNDSLPTASADYDVGDITSTRVSVVLETVVDDKIHLTEKILRAIACGHPFVLLAGPGSLAYLRSYGFQTFEPFWDESYDQETDTVQRMQMIVQTMKHIQSLSDSDWGEICKIAAANKKHFFSNQFMLQVKDELQTNLNQAVDFCMQHRGSIYWQWRKFVRRSKLVNRFSLWFKSDVAKKTVQELRRHRSHRSNHKSGPVITQ